MRSRARGLASRVATWRTLPFEAILVGLGLFVLLAAFVGADPASGVTASNSPFTDEAFNIVNARNFVLLGRWSTDEWNLHLVNLPFSLVEGVWFRLVGVGIVQARLVAIACVAVAATTLVWGLRGVIGRATALFAGLAFGASGLVLIYGRLAYLEDMVVLGLTLGTVVLARDDRLTMRWGALSGICYAIAIGAKPSASFAVAGILVGIAALAWRDRAARSWLAGAIAAIALAGLAWAVVIWLPNRDAVAMDLRIWASESLGLAPPGMLRSVLSYLTTGSDRIYGMQLGPLLALAAAGLATIAIQRPRLSRAQSRLAAVSIGWLAFGYGLLLIASYRPNRYVLPLVPPLVILAALGLYVAATWLRERSSQGPAATPADTGGPPDHEPRRWIAAALVVAVTAAAIAPGLVWYAAWARNATYDLPDIQARFAAAIPDGERVAGEQSALYLMDSKAVTLITQPAGSPANAGDLYAEGVRWYLQPIDDPAPPGVSDVIWTARQQVLCGDYGGLTQCLYRVP
jgi:hypothetical protein